jgi:hypothetical protein
MPILRRLLLAVSALAVAAALVAVPGATAAGGQPDAVASKKKGAKKPSCKKGYVAKKVTKKNGKKVWKCVKKPVKACRAATASCAIPPEIPKKGLFEAPGQKLEGEAAKPFLQKYLLNSTFTDCVTGWPSCGGFEDRYSHSADNTFYKCLLKISSGSDVKSVGEYGVTNARIEPDGSWIFQEVISWYGYYSAYEWHVSTTGVVEGAYQSTAGSGTPEKIGPLQYVGGVAKDCSY